VLQENRKCYLFGSALGAVPLTEDHGCVEREDEVVQLLVKWSAMNGCVVLLVPSAAAAAVSESASQPCSSTLPLPVASNLPSRLVALHAGEQEGEA